MDHFADIPMVCCQGPVDAGLCVCTREESTLRRYMAGEGLRPMTTGERDWCIAEADRFSEGHYSRDELEIMDDPRLAYAVLDAWQMYVQSNSE